MGIERPFSFLRFSLGARDFLFFLISRPTDRPPWPTFHRYTHLSRWQLTCARATFRSGTRGTPTTSPSPAARRDLSRALSVARLPRRAPPNANKGKRRFVRKRRRHCSLVTPATTNDRGEATTTALNRRRHSDGRLVDSWIRPWRREFASPSECSEVLQAGVLMASHCVARSFCESGAYIVNVCGP